MALHECERKKLLRLLEHCSARAVHVVFVCFTTSCQSFPAQLRSAAPAAGIMLRAITGTGGVGCARAGMGGRGTALLDAARRAGRAGGLRGAEMVEAVFASPASSFVSTACSSLSCRLVGLRIANDLCLGRCCFGETCSTDAFCALIEGRLAICSGSSRLPVSLWQRILFVGRYTSVRSAKPNARSTAALLAVFREGPALLVLLSVPSVRQSIRADVCRIRAHCWAAFA